MPLKPSSGVLHHSLLRKKGDEEFIKISYKALPGALQNLKIDSSSTAVASSSDRDLGSSWADITASIIESDEDEDDASSQSSETSQAIARMAAMSLRAASSPPQQKHLCKVITPSGKANVPLLRHQGGTQAQPISPVIEQTLQPFLRILQDLQRGDNKECVSVLQLHDAVKSKSPTYLSLMEAGRPVDYINKAQRYLDIIIVKIEKDMPYIRLNNAKTPWFVKVRDAVPSWAVQRAEILNPPLSSAMEAEKLYPLIDILLHCVPPFQLVGNGQLKRCLYRYEKTIVVTKVDLILYCSKATELCNICVHPIWGGGYCIALRDAENPFKEREFNRLYFARQAISPTKAKEIIESALKR